MHKDKGAQMGSVPPSTQAELVNNARFGLLAAKSNYEWVAEGKHTELGLHFPDSMVTSITSKRTTHSAAEKRQRDRLKSAFEDLAEVLHNCEAKTTTDSNDIVVYQEDGKKSAADGPGDPEGGGGKRNLSRIKLLELATERLIAQCKEMEKLKHG